MKDKYLYPRLTWSYDFGWFRLKGVGLANCLFLAAKAYVNEKKGMGKMLEPTWLKFSPGPFIRHEKDKRIYSHLFNHYGIRGFKKFFILITRRYRNDVIMDSDLATYFCEFNQDYDLVKEYIDRITRPETIKNVNTDILSDEIAIHARFGDFPNHLRTDINWYVGIVKNLLEVNPNLKFALFSDGTDEELKPLTDIPTVRKAFYGNAFADMYAISKCKLLIASDSTFSGWGAFMGRVPIVFNHRHFPPVYAGDVPEIILSDSTISDELRQLVDSLI